MKKKIFVGIAVLAIAAVAVLNVNVNTSQENDVSLLELANVEALALPVGPLAVIEAADLEKRPSCTCKKACSDGKTFAECTGYKSCNCGSNFPTATCDGLTTSCH